MGVQKRNKIWVVKFIYNGKRYTRSSRSTRKKDAVELERQMRQHLIDTQELGHKEHIKLYAAIDMLLDTSKESGAYTSLCVAANNFKKYFDNQHLDRITSRDLARWVEHERLRGIKDNTIRLWSRQFNKICKNADRLGYYKPNYEWGEWLVKDKPIRYLTDDEEQRVLDELNPDKIKDKRHKQCRQTARDLFITMLDSGFRIGEVSTMKWEDVDFENNVIYLFRSKVGNEDFIPMTKRLRSTLENRKLSFDREYVFEGINGSHKTIKNNRALTAAFKRAGVEGVSSHNARKTFATRLLNRGAAITDVQHLLGHASVKTTERAYAAFVKNDRFKKTVELLD